MVTTPMIPLCKHLLTDMLANICLFTHPAIMEQVIPHNCKYKQASVDLRDLNVKLIQTSDRKCVRFHVLGYITREKIQALWVTGHCVCCNTGANGAFSSNPVGKSAVSKVLYADLRDKPGFYVWVTTEISRKNIHLWSSRRTIPHFVHLREINGS